MEVHDRSMAPTLLPGDHLLVDLAAYRRRAPRVGDVVVLLDPADPSRWLVKRVAGVGPGPLWEARAAPSAGVTGGRPVDGPPPAENAGSIALPEGTVYVEGDATTEVRDSRQFGAVSFGRLVGRVYRCYAPVGRQREF